MGGSLLTTAAYATAAVTAAAGAAMLVGTSPRASWNVQVDID